jgi:2-dehydro-3-deoxyphosphogluconate aldolase/(4S)-4-hydroxy-2-oxoglutarate aldolase
LLAAAEAIRRGGVQAIEVAMTTPGAMELIAEIRRRSGAGTADPFAGVAPAGIGDGGLRSGLFGAGTVLDPETARAAILAGADFVVAPTCNLETIALCNRYGIPVIPGCYTPTEMLAAWQAGADMVKLFPASVGGPELVKAILAPLPQLQIVPVGGVTLDNVAAFIRSGAAAVGVGSELVNQKLLDAGDMEELTHRAAAFVAEVKRGRAA